MGLSSAAHIARAKKAGVEFERFNDADVLERDGYVCQVCAKACNRDEVAPHPDAATIGHRIALSCGGSHTRDNVECQCWACNAEQNNERDTPKAAKIKRQRRETGQQARLDRRKAEGKGSLIQGRTKIESRGFAAKQKCPNCKGNAGWFDCHIPCGGTGWITLKKKMNGEVIRNG